MLTLTLLRHAKAVVATAGGDFARGLSERGESDASRLGAYLAENGLRPDRALVSPSARTRQTFECIGGAFVRPPEARYLPSLYNAAATHLCQTAQATDAGIAALMILGHNPGVMDAAIALVRDGDPAAVGRMRSRFPPCSLAVLTFDTDDWRDVRPGAGVLRLFVMPDDLAPGA